eukprot:TRINITY_DN8013_c0_g1_i1.p1 TRINITY_DN8013_c0_g1~~TRINITY_DN8013_c0_g1_i1.p1  ORF type:complete len:390 (-),score=48.27 TRINITY_DN8013_c0_g1_i1:92-1261(-)
MPQNFYFYSQYLKLDELVLIPAFDYDKTEEEDDNDNDNDSDNDNDNDDYNNSGNSDNRHECSGTKIDGAMPCLNLDTSTGNEIECVVREDETIVPERSSGLSEDATIPVVGNEGSTVEPPTLCEDTPVAEPPTLFDNAINIILGGLQTTIALEATKTSPEPPTSVDANNQSNSLQLQTETPSTRAEDLIEQELYPNTKPHTEHETNVSICTLELPNSEKHSVDKSVPDRETHLVLDGVKERLKKRRRVVPTIGEGVCRTGNTSLRKFTCSSVLQPHEGPNRSLSLVVAMEQHVENLSAVTAKTLLLLNKVLQDQLRISRHHVGCVNNLQEKSGQTFKRLLQDVDDFKALSSLKAKETDGSKGVKRKRNSTPNSQRKCGKTEDGKKSTSQ